jgi:hypothetical protein
LFIDFLEKFDFNIIQYIEYAIDYVQKFSHEDTSNIIDNILGMKKLLEDNGVNIK